MGTITIATTTIVTALINPQAITIPATTIPIVAAVRIGHPQATGLLATTTTPITQMMLATDGYRTILRDQATAAPHITHQATVAPHITHQATAAPHIIRQATAPHIIRLA